MSSKANTQNLAGNQQGGMKSNQNPGNVNQQGKAGKQCDNLLDL